MPILLQYLLAFLGALFVISYGYGQWQEGRIKSKLDTVSLFKAQVDALETKVKTQTEDIEKLTKEVRELHISIEEKDKRLTELLSILQGRDPQMQSFVKLLTDYVTAGKPIVESIVSDVLPVVRRLDQFLNKEGFVERREENKTS